MRVARLELNDIGPFEDAVFEIPEPKGQGELVLFEGPNGSGKTTIVQAIACATFPSVEAHPAVDTVHRLGGELGLAPPIREIRQRIRRSSPGRAAVRLGIEADNVRSFVHITDDDDADRWESAGLASALIGRLADNAVVQVHPLTWAAFAYRAHHASTGLATAGPREIDDSPLSGALSFGEFMPESKLLGQLLANFENERTKALAYASERADEARRLDLSRVAESRQEAIRRFERVFSKVLGRRTTIEFSVDRQAPTILFDGEPIPLELMGEGLRSTMAWLSDLLVRLERVRWADTTRSPVDQDFWLILDEIDESLHPTMQARILPAVRELFPNARIYATTHSPFVVASAAEGVVFPIRPDKHHRVRGKVEPRELEPGQSLEWVVTEIFDAQAGFVDERTRDLLVDHKRDVRRFERTGDIDWDAFFARRAELMTLNDEVRTVVAMQEVPVRLEVDRRMLERAEAREPGVDA